jgi:hypothetical protein
VVRAIELGFSFSITTHEFDTWVTEFFLVHSGGTARNKLHGKNGMRAGGRNGSQTRLAVAKKLSPWARGHHVALSIQSNHFASSNVDIEKH